MVNVVLDGNLVADAETRESKRDPSKKFVVFKIASDDYSRGSANATTVYLNVRCNVASVLKMQERGMLRKGAYLSVVGSFTQSTYETSEGKKATSLEVLAYHVEYKRKAGGSSGDGKEGAE